MREEKLARRIVRVANEIEKETKQRLEQIERIMSRGDKATILSHIDGAKKAELITKLNSAVSFINSNKKQGAANRGNPLV